MKLRALLPAFAIVAAILPVSAGAQPAAMEEPLRFSSGDRQVTLLELYTSEGCSSCPPADRWVSRLAEDPRLWRDVVPLSFHVDYWDWIGWQDRFADPEFSERQRRHIREGNARVVYTPGFFANGEEWRGFFEHEPLGASMPPAGALTVMLSDRDVSVRFDPLKLSGDVLKVNVALLGMGLESQVVAGENRGRTLQHDFVVLSLKIRNLDAVSNSMQAELRLPRGPFEDATAIAAWITDEHSLHPLQAVGGYLR